MRQYHLFLLSILFPAFVWASNDMSTDFDAELAWLQEETVVISASRVAENIKKTAASVTVIDEAQIRVMGATDLWEVLRIVPGLGVTQNRIWNKKIESRGVITLMTEKVLVLLDNHALDTNLLNGGATLMLSRFPLDNVQRIEIVRGPGSALYGANAFLAVVNVITKDADELDGIEVMARGGDEQLAEGSLLLGKTMGDLKIAASLFTGRSSGAAAEMNQDAIGKSGKTNPWYRILDTYVKLKYQNFFLNGKYHLEDHGPNYGAAGALNDEDRGEVTFGFLQLGHHNALTNTLNLESRLYYNYYQPNNLWELFPENMVLGTYTYPQGLVARHKNTNTQTGVDATLTWQPTATHTTVVGFTWEEQKQFDVVHKANYNPLTFEPNDPPVLSDYSDPLHTWAPTVNRRFWAIYGEELWDVSPALHMTAGIRHDHYSDFGGVTNPRLGFSYQLSPHYIFKGLYGRAFRAPTFAELYNTNNEALEGRPDLKPEVVNTFEVGLYIDYKNIGLTGQMTLFKNNIKDLIGEVGDRHINRGKVETKGIEMTLRYDLRRGAFVEANYTYVHAKDTEQQIDLPNVARHRANLLFNWRASSNVNLFLETIWTGSKQRPDGSNRDTLSGYDIVNGTVVVSNFMGIARGLELRLRVNNLFDRSYADPPDLGFTTDDYQRPGRNFWLEGRYAF